MRDSEFSEAAGYIFSMSSADFTPDEHAAVVERCAS
jgi:hypothetical protein